MLLKIRRRKFGELLKKKCILTVFSLNVSHDKDVLVGEILWNETKILPIHKDRFIVPALNTCSGKG